MRVLNENEIRAVSGGDKKKVLPKNPSLVPEEVIVVGRRVAPPAFTGAAVIWGAVNGSPPGPDALVGTASGPSPGNRGGRYRWSPGDPLDAKPSVKNMPGGELGRMIGRGGVRGRPHP